MAENEKQQEPLQETPPEGEERVEQEQSEAPGIDDSEASEASESAEVSQAPDTAADPDGESIAPAEAEEGDTARRRGHSEERQRIKGVFSSQTVSKVGTGTTVRRTIQKSFWMVEEQDNGHILIQPLNMNYVPSGPKRTIAKDDLLRQFNPEPEFYVHTVFPAIQKLNKTVSLGEDHRKKGRNFSAEFEFNNALKVDEENVRANFGLGLTYLERGEKNKADNIFERLVKLDAAFEPEHKHLFNDFGINLRKNNMYDQAVEYYSRALELSKADEHLHYNIARAYFAKQQLDKVTEHLDQAMKLNPDFEVAKQFKEWLQTQQFLNEDGTVNPNAPLDPEAAMQANGGAAFQEGTGGAPLKVDI